MRKFLLACLFLVVFSNIAFSNQVNLTWVYTQNQQKLATKFVMQRCQIIPPLTSCANFSDLPAGSDIPVLTLNFSDMTIVPNVGYCYQVVAVDSMDRSTPSNTFCAGLFILSSPGSLSGTVK